MKRDTPIASVLPLIALIALPGCSAAPAPAPTVTVTQTVTVTATPEPPEAPADPLQIGESVPLEGATVTLHAVNVDSAPEPAPQPQSASDKWVSADVELCNTTQDQFGFSAAPWTLHDEANHAFSQSSLGYNQFPQPEFAFGDETLNAAECRRGWITFPVNRDSVLTHVKYQNAQGDVVLWGL